MLKRPVKARLTEAAFALFEEHGYDATTVDHIAERAGVGRTTFFRTFRTKEDVIFPDHDEVLAQIRARLATSTEETTLVAVSEAARLVLLHYLQEGDLARSRYRLTTSVPALRDREIASLQQYQRVFRDFIGQWMGDDRRARLRAELMAAAVVTAHNHVLRRWLRGQSDDPEREFDLAITEVIQLFADGQGDGGGDATVVVLRTTDDLDGVVARVREALAGSVRPG